MCQSLFFNKVAGQTLLNKGLWHMLFSCEFDQISKNIFSYRTPMLAASETNAKTFVFIKTKSSKVNYSDYCHISSITHYSDSFQVLQKHHVNFIDQLL